MTIALEFPYVPNPTDVEVPLSKAWNFRGHHVLVVGPEPQTAVCEPKPSRKIPQIIRNGIVLGSHKIYCEAIGTLVSGRIFVSTLEYETRCKIARLLMIRDMGMFGGDCGLGVRQHHDALVLHSHGWSVCYYATQPSAPFKLNRMSKRFEVPELEVLRGSTGNTAEALAIVAKARLFKEG